MHEEAGLDKDNQVAAAQSVRNLVLQGGEATRVLVIEDDDTVRRLLKSALSRAKYQVFEAQDGVSGLQLCDAEAVDLVVTDIMMPLMSGLEVIARLRSDYPQIRIIAISGGLILGGVDLLSEAKRLGADYCISKPFDLSRVVWLVGELAGMA
jgi:CheY-like chemotaxis protein